LIRQVDDGLRNDDRIDAIKQLGALNCSDPQVVGALVKVIENESDDRVIYEATKSLILLGNKCVHAAEYFAHFIYSSEGLY
jgi:hypothetical protein